MQLGIFVTIDSNILQEISSFKTSFCFCFAFKHLYLFTSFSSVSIWVLYQNR